MALDGLTDAFDHLSMGESTEDSGRKLGITREQQDEFAAMSHQRAAAATKNGLFAAEIVGVPIPQRGGETLTVTQDEGIRPGTTAETLAKLKPAFSRDGTITAGDRFADLRRRRRRRGDVRTGGRTGRAQRARRDRGARQRGGAG